MVKRWFVVGLILLLMSLLAVGCGIPQEEHDAVVGERDSAQAEVQSVRSELQSVQSELDTAKSELQSVQSELDTAKSELQSVEGELNTAKSELQSGKDDLSAARLTIKAQEQAMAKAKTEAEIINALFVPVLKGEEGEIDPISFLFEWRDKVEATDDAVLKLKLDAVMDSEGGEEELLDFFLYLFENIPETLQ